jgi:hypothetical protein
VNSHSKSSADLVEKGKIQVILMYLFMGWE